jgi:hypothetical protein
MNLRLLLDQNFPRPPGFDLASVDATVEAVHVYDHDRTLTEAGTPDWLIYLRAAEDGFDALVTRDWHQMDQPEEGTAARLVDIPCVERSSTEGCSPCRRSSRPSSSVTSSPSPVAVT